jgi:hypothetical protein
MRLPDPPFLEARRIWFITWSAAHNRAEWLSTRPAAWRCTAHQLCTMIDITNLSTSGGEVTTAMHNQTVSKMLVLLLAVCCLVPLAALVAVFYLAVPVWLVAPTGLLALVLLARRLMALLAVDDEPDISRDFPAR